MKNPISISQLARIFSCVYAGVLPRVRVVGKHFATRGVVLHRFLQEVNTLGYERALENVEPDFVEECKVIDMARMPKAGEYAAEVAWAYNWVTDTARELGRGIDRRYDGLVDEDCEIAGTADVVGITDEAVVILDYKTGFADLGPAANSWQLKGYAVAAARAYGKSKAVVGFIRIGPSGVPWFNVEELSAADVDAAAGEIRELMEQARQLRVAETFDEHGQPLVFRDDGTDYVPQYVEGPHCDRCASFPFCAAKMRLVAQLAAAPQDLLQPVNVAVLSERELSVAHARLKLVKDLVERVEYAMKDRARLTPFPVEGRPGYVYGPVETIEDEVQVEDASAFLMARFGAEIAEQAVTLSMSKASIQRAIEASGWLKAAPGRKITPTMKSLVEELRTPLHVVTHRGGVSKFETEEGALRFYGEVSKTDPTAQHYPNVIRGIIRRTSVKVTEHKAKANELAEVPGVKAIGAGAPAVEVNAVQPEGDA